MSAVPVYIRLDCPLVASAIGVVVAWRWHVCLPSPLFEQRCSAYAVVWISLRSAHRAAASCSSLIWTRLDYMQVSEPGQVSADDGCDGCYLSERRIFLPTHVS